jgi:hypothetical protein
MNINTELCSQQSFLERSYLRNIGTQGNKIVTEIPQHAHKLIEELIDNGYKAQDRYGAIEKELQASPSHFMPEDLTPRNIMSNIYYKQNEESFR